MLASVVAVVVADAAVAVAVVVAAVAVVDVVASSIPSSLSFVPVVAVVAVVAVPSLLLLAWLVTVALLQAVCGGLSLLAWCWVVGSCVVARCSVASHRHLRSLCSPPSLHVRVGVVAVVVAVAPVLAPPR